jgi:hypothetical protein
MKRGKIGAFLLGAALCLTAWSGQASAEGNIWMDENAEILPYQYKKVVVYPIRYLQEQDGNYETAPKYNKMLLDRLNKRGKGVNWMGFSPMLEEKKHILRDNPKYDHLRDHFATEKERAAAVYDATAADGYLLPHVRWDQVRVDHSPATWTTVKIETYYDEKNGPKGNRDKLNYHSWHESHLIPAHDSNLRMLDMDFSLLDREGNKTLTLIDYYRDYERSTEHALNQIFKNFTGDWSRLRRDKPQEAAAGAPTLGFRNLNLPASAGRDEYSIKTIYYAYKDAAGDRMKGVKVDYTPNAGQYYVTGTVDTYQRGQTWHPPYADTSTYLDETKKFTWTDADGNSHEGKREYYKTSVHDYYGYYTFWYKVGASLRLVDASTGQTIFQHHYAADDTERFGNALRSVFNDFYRDVERSIGVKVD